MRKRVLKSTYSNSEYVISLLKREGARQNNP